MNPYFYHEYDYPFPMPTCMMGSYIPGQAKPVIFKNVTYPDYSIPDEIKHQGEGILNKDVLDIINPQRQPVAPGAQSAPFISKTMSAPDMGDKNILEQLKKYLGGQKEQVAPAQGWKMPPGYAALKENRDWRYK